MVKATNIEVGLTLNDQATKGLQKFEDALDSAGTEGKQAFDKVSKEAKEAGAAIDKATGRTRDARERVVKLGTDGEKAFTKVGKEAKGTGAAVKGTGDKARDTGDKFTKLGGKGKKGLGQIDKAAKKSSVSLGKMAAGIGVAFAAFKAFQVAGRTGLGFIRDAAKFEEDVAKFGVVFGEEALRVAEQLDVLSGAVKRSKGELIDFASGFQDIFVPLGFARAEAADLSVNLTKLAIDVGSFNNALDIDVIRDFKSALVGNSETVRKYGILIDEARIKSVAYASGITKVGEEVTQQQKVIARYQILLADTSDAFGDAERTAGSFANTMKGVQAVASDLGIVFGQELQKTVLDNIKAMGGLDGVTDIIKVSFAAVTTATEAMIDAVGTVGVAFKGLIDGLGGADKVVALIRGEFELTEEAGRDLAKALSYLDNVLVAAFNVMRSTASIAGGEIARGFFMALGLSLDREGRAFAIKYDAFVGTSGSVLLDIVKGFASDKSWNEQGEEAITAYAEGWASRSQFAADTIEKALTTGLSEVEVDAERLIFATTAKGGGVLRIVQEQLKLDGVEDVAKAAEEKVTSIFEALVAAGANVTRGAERAGQGIKLSNLFKADPADFPKILKVLEEQLPKEAINKLIAGIFERFDPGEDTIEAFVLDVPSIIDVSVDERNLKENRAKLDEALGSFFGHAGDAVDKMLAGGFEIRELSIADAFKIDTGDADEVISSVRGITERIHQELADSEFDGELSTDMFEDFRFALNDIAGAASAGGVDLPGQLLGDLLMAIELLDLGEEFHSSFASLKEPAAEAGADAGEALGDGVVVSAKDALKALSAQLRVVTEEVKAGIVSDFAAFELGIQIKIAKVEGDESLSDEQRTRAVAALNAQLGMEIQLRTAAEATAIRQRQSEDGRLSIATSMVALIQAQLVPMAEAVMAQERIEESEQRILELRASLGDPGARWQLEVNAINQAADASIAFATARAGQSATEQELLRQEIALINQKRDATLGTVTVTEDATKATTAWGDMLGDQEAGLKLQADLAGAFDTAVGGLARSFVDASTSWADFRDQFLMSIAQMIVKALLLAAIEATIRAFSFGTFASGGVAEGVDTNAMGGVTTGVGSMSTGPAPPNFFAMGGVQGGTMKAHSDDMVPQRGAQAVKAFADGGVMEGVGSHKAVRAFADGGVMEGVGSHKAVRAFADGGVMERSGSVATGPAPPNFFATGGVQGGTMKAHSDDLGFERGAKTVKAFADGGIMEGVGSHMPVSAFANGGVMGGLPVHQYAIGGIARTPQLAVFGEGRGAEAFVPLPDGKSIPVKMDGSSGPISVNLTVASLDPRTAADVVLAQMPKIRKELAAALREGTDRSLTEGVRGAARR